jgi:hypothetical protein
MDAAFTPKPHREAMAILSDKRPVAARVFYGMLPELRGRAFTISGIEGAAVLQRCRDAIAALPRGIGDDGEPLTWDTQKKLLVEEMDPYLGEDGATTRAQLLLRVNTFQAYSASIYRTAQADDDTTHLQYIHGDQAKDPTPSHVALDGIILPKDDPFWDTHTGPWGHLGCVCYVRPMNPDLVEEARQQDQQEIAAGAPPENADVIEGPRRTQLEHGTIIRDGQRFDVSPPTGRDAFRWHPDDLRFSLGDIKLRYDPEVWADFAHWARSTMIMPETTLWNWLKSKPSPPSTKAEIARANRLASQAISERQQLQSQ